MVKRRKDDSVKLLAIMTFFSFLEKGEVIKTILNIPCELGKR
jgi:hypothetical protein